MPERPRCSRGRPVRSRNPEQLERKIVVSLLQRARKILETRPTGAARLGARRRRSAAPSAAFAVKIARSAAAAAKYQHLPDVDLGRVAGLVLLVLPLPVF